MAGVCQPTEGLLAGVPGQRSKENPYGMCKGKVLSREQALLLLDPFLQLLTTIRRHSLL